MLHNGSSRCLRAASDTIHCPGYQFFGLIKFSNLIKSEIVFEGCFCGLLFFHIHRTIVTDEVCSHCSEMSLSLFDVSPDKMFQTNFHGIEQVLVVNDVTLTCAMFLLHL